MKLKKHIQESVKEYLRTEYYPQDEFYQNREITYQEIEHAYSTFGYAIWNKNKAVNKLKDQIKVSLKNEISLINKLIIWTEYQLNRLGFK